MSQQYKVITLRITPAAHQRIVRAAARANRSINTWLYDAVVEQLGVDPDRVCHECSSERVVIDSGIATCVDCNHAWSLPTRISSDVA